jgi:two-component system response regulator AlgR
VAGSGEPRQHVAVRGRDGLRRVRIEDVYCFVAEQKYTTVHHAGGEDVIGDSLRTLELSFGARVLRIHRNTLVATHRVLALSRSEEGQYTMTIDGLAAPLRAEHPSRDDPDQPRSAAARQLRQGAGGVAR